MDWRNPIILGPNYSLFWVQNLPSILFCIHIRKIENWIDLLNLKKKKRNRRIMNKSRFYCGV